ncbi:hemagglutinin repeat-containing protein [Cupriavidus metallidurans]|uniref:hemagglutinin repeat-containing protein n=1 Tax=Cupriavidus metallidurans TaxID=119219 RepID=UPI0009B896EE|nr:hemagglutinin repeat-containing protein [Cupriavidus metallidurans]
MNTNLYRLVFNAAHGMLVAVQESAANRGKGRHAGSGKPAARAATVRFALPAITLGVWMAMGVPVKAVAQIVADPNAGAHRPTVGQTANGLPQVDITRPSAAGVSLNHYSQFDVNKPGAILNNSPAIVATQQAGYINGNPNLLPGQGARIIVNQVTGTMPSQLQGYVEVAGARSEVVIANPNGLMVNGLGFINTSRATLTTGTPVFGGSGSLDAFRVTGGQILVQGAGMNAANVDQVDLIARAVQANASLYANRLNVIAGANQVDHDTLRINPIAGAGLGPGPAQGIDVAQLGGMYANKILLASTEQGVGVSLRGIAAAQAGDLTLTTQGKLVLAGQTNASGNLTAHARDGIDNSGTTYATQAVSLDTDGVLSHTGTLAAQQQLDVKGGSVNSTGTLAAGVNQDGTVAAPADLVVSATGTLTATGRNQASGNATLRGGNVTLAGSQTSAGGNLDLTASTGDLDLTGATTTAGAGLTANASGAVVNDRGQMSSRGATTLTAGSVSNAGGQLVSQGAMTLQSAGAVNNDQGTVQADGALNASAASLDNTGGRIASLNADGLSVGVTGTLTNVAGTTANGAQGGVIGGNGNVRVVAGDLVNHGQISAQGDASIQAAALDNSSGSLTAGGALDATIAGSLNNRQGTISGAQTSLAAQSLDNSAGLIEGNQLAMRTSANLLNLGGKINQFGQTDTTIAADGKLDNTGGSIAANGQNLTVQGGTLINDNGKISHAGAGLLTVQAAAGLDDALRNAKGAIQTNGDLRVQAASLDNTQGMLSAQRATTLASTGDLVNRQGSIYGQTGLTLTSGGHLDNTAGSAQSAGDLSIIATGALTNTGGTVAANGAHEKATIAAASVDNTRGKMVNAGDGVTAITATTSLINTAGKLGGNGDVSLRAATFANNADDGDDAVGAATAAGGALDLKVSGQVDNRGGTLSGSKGVTLDQAGATLNNDGGQVLGGTDVMLTMASMTNAGGAVKANQDIAVAGALSGSGTVQAGRNLSVKVTGDYTNDAANNLRADGDMLVSATGTLTNTGKLAAAGGLTIKGADVVNAAGAGINSATTRVEAANTLTNAGRIEGNTVNTDATTTTNTGTIIGNTVTVQGQDIVNEGASALMAAVGQLNLYATNSVRNLDGANLYSAGNLQIARDGTRDPVSGMLVNQVDTLINSSATIQAEGDIDIAARQVENKRTRIVTEAGTPVESARQTLVLWMAGFPEGQKNYASTRFPQWRWNGDHAAISADMVNALRQPITVEVPKADVKDVNSATKTLSFVKAPVDQTRGPWTCTTNDVCDYAVADRQIVRNPVQHYEGLEETATSYRITFWPDFDPAVHLRPDQVRIRYDLGTDSHDYNEISRTTVTTTATDKLVSATPAALIQAEKNVRINSDGGSILNQSSTIAAGGDLTRSAVGGAILDTGTVLQQKVDTQETSTFLWHQKTAYTSDIQVVPYPVTPQAPTTVEALPAITSANKAVQTTAQTIDVATVNRLGETVTGSGITGGGATGTQAGGASGNQGKPTQTLGTAQGGIPNLTLPTNGLYRYQPAPGSTYLIATDPRFTQYARFISSDYMLGQLGLDPLMTQKRLGDGLYEEKLIRDQVTQLTGRTYLAGFSNNLDEYQRLMDNGVQYARSFSLTPGIGLSDAQMAQLTTDMVWLVSQDVTLPDGTRQTVLVPKVYLAQASTVNLQDTGALVSGNTVSMNATGDLSNSGRIVGDLATQVIGETIVNRGVVGGTGTTVVQAVQDVRNLGGQITGTDTFVSAGRDVINQTQTISNATTLENGYRAGATGIGAVASISGKADVAVLAGRDISLDGGAIEAGKRALLAAGRDLNVGTVALGTTQDAESRGGQSYSHDRTTTHAGSLIQAGENAMAVAGRDATLTGSTLQTGGNATVVAGRDVTVTAAIDTHSHREGSMGGSLTEYRQSSYDETARGSQVQAGENVTLAAGQSSAASALLKLRGIEPAADAAGGKGNLAVLGSGVSTGNGTSGGGAAQLIATGDVTVGTVTEAHDGQFWMESRRSGFLSKTQTTTQSSQQQAVAVGSVVSADSVAGSAGRDLTVSGSSVAGSGDVSLHADRNLVIGAAQSTASSNASQETRKSGLFSNGGASFTIGKQQINQNQTTQTTTHTGSLVGSVGGNVNLSAGEGYTQTGSVVKAAQGDVDIHAKTVDINAATDMYRMDQETHFRQSGLTVSVSNPLIAAAQTGSQMAKAQGKTDDARMKALAGVAGGLAAKNAYDAVKADPTTAGGLNISVTVGGSRSDSQQTQTATTAVGSQISAGRDVRIRAEGGGESSNLNVIGSNIQAGNDLLLKADNQVNLQAAVNTAEQHSSSKSLSGGVGVGVNLSAKGASLGVTANAAGSRGNADGNDVTWTTSHATAGNTLTIESGGDTNVKGAVASGKQVVANVGGDLNIESLQDTSTYRSKDQSVSGSVTFGMGTGLAGSVNVGQQKIDSDFASVGEQSAIRAGSGGYQIDVQGNTDLKGAVIGGGAADKNSLSTGTLTVSDIENRAKYSGNSFSIGGGFSFGGGGGKSEGESSGGGDGGVGLAQRGQATTGGDAVPGTALPTTGGNGQGFSFAPPMVVGASGSASSTTQSGVSAGTITIGDEGKQEALSGKNAADTVASLNRDTTNTGNALSPIFDKAKIEAGFEIVGALQRESGVFLNNRAHEADAASKAAEAAAKDPSASAEQRAALQQQAADLAKWGQGGTYRQIMTALTAAASGNVTGSSAQFVQSAAVGYLQGLAANQVKGLADSLGKGTPEAESARAALHAIVGCAGAAGAGQGCGAGAMGAAASSVIGSLLSPPEGLTPGQKQARENAIQSLVAGVAGAAGASGVDAATATNAATFEIENNWLSLKPVQPPLPISTPGQPQKPFQTPGKPVDPSEVAVTGTPDQSRDNQSKPIIQPIVDTADAIGAVVGGVLPNPLKTVEGLGAIFSNGDSTQRPTKTPNTGGPDTWVTNPGSGQQRLYGADGKPLVDIDTDHPHDGISPHVHNWDRAPDGTPIRGPGIPVTPITPSKP